MSVFERGLSRISVKRKKRAPLTSSTIENGSISSLAVEVEKDKNKKSVLSRGMNRLRQSIRQSFRRRKSPERIPPSELVGNSSTSSKQEQWQPDESAVRAGLCCFNVKYLGSVEVFESRGMHVCEHALKSLRNQNSRRRPIKAVLYISGDGLRVVDQQNNRGLIVDQTIEKVSFCAPDRNNDKGFAYICRDGTSRRWMCHGFNAQKETGERLSHAVGCAFTICLERKKKRDDDSGVVTVPQQPITVEKALNPDWGDSSDPQPSTNQFEYPTKTNPAYQSFRKQITMSERLQDPQSAIVNNVPTSSAHSALNIAKPRPVANPALFQRQGSLRAPERSTHTSSDFKRNFSLRAGSVDTKLYPNIQSFHNEPIYEGDEEPTPTQSFSSATAPPSTTHTANGVSGASGYSGSGTNGAFEPYGSGVSAARDYSNHVYGNIAEPRWQGTVANRSVPTTLPLTSQISPSESTNSCKSKADEWLETALKSSISPTSPVAQQNWSAMSSLGSFGNGVPTQQYQVAPQVDLLDLSTPVEQQPSTSFRYSAPPTQAPPPLPSRSVVVNNKPVPSVGSSLDAFGQPVNWEAPVAGAPQRPEDPFDVQWSLRALSTNNPFSSKA